MRSGEQPTVVVINTCTVTGDAEKKTRKAVRRALRDYPQAAIYVTGCSVAIAPETYKQMDDRVRVVTKADMQSALQQFTDTACVSHPEHNSAQIGRVRKGIKIQDGCNNACTYCIVHTARGQAHSLEADKVLKQCTQLLQEGVPEIILTGINLGAYENDNLNLAALLRMLLETLPLHDEAGNLVSRLRLSSIEPQDFTEELAAAVARADGAVCRHFHLPLQSGSTSVLQAMARRYSADDFLQTVTMIRSYMPHASITTDVIAGFPGESEEDFEHTVALCKKAQFSKLHVFPYSPRAGTPAATWPNHIDPSIKDVRTKTLHDVSTLLRQADYDKRIGSSEWAVIETPTVAHTESYHCVTPQNHAATGTLQQVVIPAKPLHLE